MISIRKIKDNPIIRYLAFLIKPNYKPNRNAYDIIYNYYTDTIPASVKDLIDSSANACYSVDGRCVGIKYWIEDQIALVYEKSYRNFRPLMQSDDSLIFYSKNALYKGDLKHIPFRLCDFRLEDGMYCEMVEYDNSYYAIRDGGKLYVSRNLTEWKLVYDCHRGIKNSMVITSKGDDVVVIFIEYSTGFHAYHHKVLQYSFNKDEITSLKEFNNLYNEIFEEGKDYARHIHVIQKDPYTGDLYLGTGDEGVECSIYRSKDNGDNWSKLFTEGQQFRTLSFVFTDKSIYWNTDTYERQFINEIRRDFLEDSNKEKKLISHPLINGALWCTMDVSVGNRKLTIMSSNSEGALFDNYNRVYGLDLSEDGIKVYELLRNASKSAYSQKFPCCAFENRYFFYDGHTHQVNQYRMEIKQ